MTTSIIRDGTSREERLLPALKEGYFDVDELGFEDLFAMAAEYAGLLEYRNLENRPEGSWRTFFESDEAGLLASLMAIDAKKLHSDSRHFILNFGARLEDIREGRAGIDSIPLFRVADRIDNAYVRLAASMSQAAVRIREKIAESVERALGKELRQTRDLLENFGIDTGATFGRFHPLWELEEVPTLKSGSEKAMIANFQAFHNAFLLLQEEAGKILAISLQRGDHEPAMGLFIVFLRLFAKVQGKLNRFTHRHLLFYYGEVLKVARRPFVPDRVHLLLVSDVPGREVVVGKGTEFLAGVGEEQRVYASDEEIVVTDAKVCELHTIHVDRDERMITKGHPLASSVKLDRLLGTEPRPIFGARRHTHDGKKPGDARLGFAVASDVLLLGQGKRDVEITFRFAQVRDLGMLVKKLGEDLETTEADAFFKAFRNMFRISITSEKGWMDVGEYLPLCSVVDAERCEEGSFLVEFRVPESAGAVVPYSAQVHGENLETDLPVVRFVLDPDAYLYAWSLLCELPLEEISIEAEVSGCTDILIYNQLGELSADAQFAPFGQIPAQGDYLVVGCHEASRKRLVDFEVELEWAGLPVRGFEDHYRAYGMPFGNGVFRVDLAVLRDRAWVPAEGMQVALFEEEDGKAARTRCISFRKLCQFTRLVRGAGRDEYAYGPRAKAGFFRISLSSPQYAFGHRDYPLILSRVMTENAKLDRFGITGLLKRNLPRHPLPGQPYTPMVKAVSVNYRATSRISMEQEGEGRSADRIFHLHPLGFEALSPRSYGKVSLVPNYDADGNLYIGISATRISGTISLFFHLRDDSLPEAGAMDFDFSWHYLSSNRWKRLDRSRLVSDTTCGFLSSGIVVLEIPDDINRENTVLPSGLFWLRVSASGADLHALCTLHGVHAQAICASWTGAGPSSHLSSGLPAGTIRASKRTLTGISEIRQITDSFGGMEEEGEEAWTIRVSERLKHKMRAVTPWDYERLVLQNFPEIGKVKCFPCMDSERKGAVAPGHLLVVMIPRLGESSNMQPMVNAMLIRKVREFLAGIAPPFASISVRNPAYEKVQVRCKVRFRKGSGQGLYLKRLEQEIHDYLSPWSPVGHGARFGWSMSCNEIEAHVRELEYIESVSGLSLLHVSESGPQSYTISDTARQKANEIRPTHPWSILIPFRNHLIEVVDESGAWLPEETGISKLAIGSTLVLSRGNS
ncbi:MAG: hypothetical protein HKL98_06660 [Burkholderiales bacterium]|nr:hypothetical protein [Burkholderiales bacterium]